MSNSKTTFELLIETDVNDKVETKQRQKYLSWTYAWEAFKKACPDANYEVLENADGLPFFESQHGIMVKTKVTANGETLCMWLPVMDGANRAMKSQRCEYTTSTGKQYVVEAATMFDINKAIMRCIVKNIAMFGLGLYIFSGEDMPSIALIDSIQMAEITKYASDNKINLSEFLRAWSVEKVNHLWACNFDAAMQYLQDLKNAAGTSKN